MYFLRLFHLATRRATSGSTYYGNFTEFNTLNEDWNRYIEGLELFFKASNIERGKWQPIFLSTVGAETYKIFKGLAAPVKPKHKSYDESMELMKNHRNPKPSVIAKSFRFNKRDKKQGERIV